MNALSQKHIATVDEPLPPLRRVGYEGPDLAAATPLDCMLAELACLTSDVDADVERFSECVHETGCSLMAHYDPEGELGLSVLYPLDSQSRHRNRYMVFLLDDFDKVAERRDLLLRGLVARGAVCRDDRPTRPRETTTAVRDFLTCGGRLLIDPEGQLREGGEIPEAFATGDDAMAAECLRASRAYFAARRRWRADRQIMRAVRMLGTATENGWIVLAGAAS